jgi:hypothetical protein
LQLPSDIEDAEEDARQRSNAIASPGARASSPGPGAATPPQQGEDAKGKTSDKKKAKDKKKRAKSPGTDDGEGTPGSPGPAAVRLSTGVHLLDPAVASQQAAERAKAAAQAEGAQLLEAEALKPFHPLIRGVMMSQRFVEPTPIQVGCGRDTGTGVGGGGGVKAGGAHTCSCVSLGSGKVGDTCSDILWLQDRQAL